MKNIRYILSLAAIGAAVALTGCKTDKEPAWDEVETSEPEPGKTADVKSVRLNELNGNKPTKYIELYNTSDQTVDISGVKMVKNGSEEIYVAPKGTTIEGHGYKVLVSDQTSYSTGFTSGLSAKKSLMIELTTSDGSLIDVFKDPSIAKGNTWDEADPKYNGNDTGEAYGRNADGTGDWYMIAPTQGMTNNGAKTSTKITW